MAAQTLDVIHTWFHVVSGLDNGVLPLAAVFKEGKCFDNGGSAEIRKKPLERLEIMKLFSSEDQSKDGSCKTVVGLMPLNDSRLNEYIFFEKTREELGEFLFCSPIPRTAYLMQYINPVNSKVNDYFLLNYIDGVSHVERVQSLQKLVWDSCVEAHRLEKAEIHDVFTPYLGNEMERKLQKLVLEVISAFDSHLKSQNLLTDGLKILFKVSEENQIKLLFPLSITTKSSEDRLSSSSGRKVKIAHTLKLLFPQKTKSTITPEAEQDEVSNLCPSCGRRALNLWNTPVSSIFFYTSAVVEKLLDDAIDSYSVRQENTDRAAIFKVSLDRNKSVEETLEKRVLLYPLLKIFKARKEFNKSHPKGEIEDVALLQEIVKESRDKLCQAKLNRKICPALGSDPIHLEINDWAICSRCFNEISRVYFSRVSNKHCARHFSQDFPETKTTENDIHSSPNISKAKTKSLRQRSNALKKKWLERIKKRQQETKVKVLSIRQKNKTKIDNKTPSGILEIETLQAPKFPSFADIEGLPEMKDDKAALADKMKQRQLEFWNDLLFEEPELKKYAISELENFSVPEEKITRLQNPYLAKVAPKSRSFAGKTTKAFTKKTKH